MSFPIIHPIAKTFLDQLAKQPPHALLIAGPKGIGTKTVAEWWAGEVTKPAYIRIVMPENGTITIETIRSLYVQTRSKADTTRVVILDDADAMSPEAQNAFLKLLEEPTNHTMFVLTSHKPHVLLPTITSRVQTVLLNPITQKDSLKIITSSGITDALIQKQLLFLANGLPAELTRLASDEAYRTEHLKAAEIAKQLLNGTRFERLSTIAACGNDRDKAMAVIHTAEAMLSLQLSKQPGNESLIQKLETLNIVENRLVQNGNVRAQLLLAAI